MPEDVAVTERGILVAVGYSTMAELAPDKILENRRFMGQ